MRIWGVLEVCPGNFESHVAVILLGITPSVFRRALAFVESFQSHRVLEVRWVTKNIDLAYANSQDNNESEL